MGTGPRASGAFDLALTEMFEDGRHIFLVEVASDRGAEILAELPQEAATPQTQQRASEAIERAAVRCRSDWPQTASVQRLLSSPLGRDCRALSRLRQLHDGLPDLFL